MLRGTGSGIFRSMSVSFSIFIRYAGQRMGKFLSPRPREEIKKACISFAKDSLSISFSMQYFRE